MSETGRPTALGVARARFVEGLPRKAQELRASTALLVASPAEERPREELRRRLHALWASAQVFQIDALCDGLKDAIERLDRARDAKAALRQDDLDALAALAATLPLLGAQAAGQVAVPSAPPQPALLRTSTAPRLRPPQAAGRPTLIGLGAMPSAVVDLETVCTVAVVGSEASASAVRAAFGEDPRLEVHGLEAGESASALIERSGPDVVLTTDAVEAAALRDLAGRIGAVVRVLGAQVTGGLPPPSEGDGFTRALKLTLRELPPLEPRHIEARLADLERSLASDRARVSNRFDGLSIGALLDRVRTGRPDSTIHLRDAHDAIDAEMRGGELCDVVRTASDGWYSRGAAALVPLLGMRRGLVTVERASGTVRRTLADPESALRSGRERLAALERATRPGMIAGIATLDIDTDAAPSAKKERAVDTRVLDAVLRVGAVAPLLDGGTSPEGLSAALLALARAGALTGIRGPAGEDRVAEALETLQSEPPPSEPEIRTLTYVPPAPTHLDDADAGQRVSRGSSEVVEARDLRPSREPVEEDAETVHRPTPAPSLPAGAAAPATESLFEDMPGSDPPPEPRPVEPRPAEPTRKASTPEPVVELRRRPEPAEPRRAEARPTGSRKLKPGPDEASRPVPPPPPIFIYALVLAVLFLSGFVLWRLMRPTVPAPRPPATSAEHAADPTLPPEQPPAAPPAHEPETALAPEPTPPAPTAPGEPQGLGGTRPNADEPPAGMGWVLLERGTAGEVQIGGSPLRAGEPVAVSLGIQPVTLTNGDSVRVRFVRVTAESTRLISATP